MVARRSVLPVVLGAAALLPALLWLSPALFEKQAPSFRDQGDFFFPLKLYTAGRIASGQLPLWNPQSGLGEPWLANGQSGVFYPPTLLFLLPSAALAGGLFLLLHFLIGISGAWRFLKDEAVSDPGALLGSAAYGACGFAASLSAYWNHFGAWAYLPWIASLARSGLRSRASRPVLAISVALQALAGSPEISAATLCVAALFAWESRREHPDSGWLEPPRGKRLLRLAGGAGLGLALAGVTLVPMSELVLRSERRVPLPRAERDWGSVGLAGLSSALGLSPESSANGYLSSLYAGPLLLCAAAGAFAEEQRRRLALLLGAVAVAGILLSMAAPPGPWLRSLPLLDRVRYPAKALVWTFFALPMLAGIGADSVRFAPGRRRALLAAAIALGGLSLLLFSRQPLAARLAEGIGLAALAWLALARAPSSSAGPSGASGAVFEAGAALALTASLFIAVRPAFRFAPESEIRRVPQSIPFLARVAGRVLTPPPLELAPWVLRDARFDAETLRRQREALLGYTNLLSGVATVRTASALPTRAQERIAASIDAGNFTRAAGAAAGRVLWSPFTPANMGLRTVGEFSRAPLNPYRSRLSFVPGYRVEPDPDRAWERSARGELDWSREVFLDREPEPRPAPGGKRSFVIARIAEDLPERVTADINSGAAGILVLADLNYPGWKAAVDGRPAPILSADGYLRAVALSAGSHRVVFRYRPVSLYAGAALSLLALAMLLAMLLRT